MIDTAHQQIRNIAERAGWSDTTLVRLAARWADETGHAHVFREYLNRTPSADDLAGASD